MRSTIDLVELWSKAMTPRRLKTRLFAALAPRRIFWCLLALVHIPAVFRLSGTVFSDQLDVATLSTWLGLCLGLAFFALKIWDVSFLRLRGRPITLLAFLLVCGVVHRNAVPSAMPQEAPVAAIVVLATLGLARAPALRRGLGQFLNTLAALIRSCIIDAPAPRGTVDDHAAARPWTLLTFCQASPRAPPA